MQREI